MYKSFTVLLVLAVSASAFQIRTEEIQEPLVEQSVGAIPWPFTVCGEGDWKIEGLTLDQTPKRNINDNIAAVNYLLFIDWNSKNFSNF